MLWSGDGATEIPKRTRREIARDPDLGLGHGDLQATTRYVKILDQEDPKAADVMSVILGDVA